MKTIAQRLLVGLLCLGSVPQAMAQGAEGLVELEVDHAAFAYDQDEALLEVYMAFGLDTLPFEYDSLGYRARLPLDLAVVRNTDATLEGTPEDPVWHNDQALDLVVPDTAAISDGQYYVQQTRIPVQPGEYELRIVVPGDTRRGRQQLELRQDVLVPDFMQDDLVGLSDVTLATAIEPSEDRENPFYKNGLLIQPSANQLYGETVSRLFYYAEAYNAGQIANDQGQYTVLAYLSEANQAAPLPGLQRRTQRAARTPDVLAGMFDLGKLPTGSYFFHLVLLDESNEARAEQARKFFVYNPHIEREAVAEPQVTFEASAYATMTQEEVEQGLKHIEYIASEAERRRARSIRDLDEQRRFLMEFWQKRDPNLATPINEYRDEFYGLIQYANDRYSNNFREGWRTDRGRVVIKYGMPAHIEPHLYDSGTLPYEIWEYNNIPGEGRAIFVFYDPTGYGEFELLHSSVTGERHSVDWEYELQRQ